MLVFAALFGALSVLMMKMTNILHNISPAVGPTQEPGVDLGIYSTSSWSIWYAEPVSSTDDT
jgi:hypothetical protein